jgi:type I restriction enzyme S subunit
LLVIRPVDKRVLDSKFLFYLLFAQDFQSYMTLNGTGSTFAGVSQTAIGRYRFSYPGYHTQRQIATYLDKKTEAIDTLIAKKQMMIELLEEKRSALINHVVTKGLNPDAPMKDSGVPWIGEVPAHWRIKKGKTLFKELNRTIPKHSNIVTVFRDGEVTLRINRRTEGFTIALKEIGYQGVNKGDLVINSMDAFAGAIGVSDSTGRCTPEYVVLSPLREAHPLYYKHLLRLMASSEYILVQCSAVRQRAPRFRFSHFATTLLAEPPKEEQIKIADVIQLETSKTSHLISSLGTQFTKLQEYRQSLITAAVTGKIDVTRDPTSDDPEEAVSGQGTLF